MSRASIAAAYRSAIQELQSVDQPTTSSYWMAALRVAQAVSSSTRGPGLRRDDPVVVSAISRREHAVSDYLLRHMWDAQQAARELAIAEGRDPDVEARRAMGLTRRQVEAVFRYRRELEDGDRSAAHSRQLRDRRMDRASMRTEEQRERAVGRYIQRYVAHRARTIARTEMTRARNTAIQLAWEQAVRDGREDPDQIRRFWEYIDDDRVRHAHRMIPSMSPSGVRIDEPFPSPLGPIMYPGDPEAEAANVIGCRCGLQIRRI